MLDIELYAASGRPIDNQYKLIRPISSAGGTADVWLALDMNTVKDRDAARDLHGMNDAEIERLGLIVAIKIYRPQNALDIEGEQRFRDEYTIVFNCHHTNLIHPTHFSIFQETPYLVLPYCKQGSSERLIGRIPDADTLWKYIEDVASGLAYLHALTPPIIHQDIKPGNVLLDDNGNYAITDFGISAKSGGDSDSEEGEERSGTMAYMAPERFHDGAEPSAESDVWAFGATLCELLTGQVPFGEEGGWTQEQNQAPVPTLPADVPADVQRLVAACLDADPTKRPTATYISQAAHAHQYPLKPKRTGLIIGIIAVAALLVGGTLAFFLRGEPEVQIITEDNRIPPEVAYAQAMAQVNQADADSLRAGMALLDSLSGAGYVPAIYEAAHTYGWYSDSTSVSRKQLLGIDIFQSGDSRFLPKADRWSNKAVALFTNMLEQRDSAYAALNAEAAYRLACYYEVPNSIFQRNPEKSKRFLTIGADWARLAGDEQLLQRINKGLERLGAK